MTEKMNSKNNNENSKNNDKKEMSKMRKTTIGKKLSTALQAAGYTVSTFVAACAAEAEVRRQTAAKAAKRAAAIAAKKARDEERRTKDEARKAKAAARRAKKTEKKALFSWKAAVQADYRIAIKADEDNGNAWGNLVVQKETPIALAPTFEDVVTRTFNRVTEMVESARNAAEQSAQRKEQFEEERGGLAAIRRDPNADHKYELLRTEMYETGIAYKKVCKKLQEGTTLADYQERCQAILRYMEKGYIVNITVRDDDHFWESDYNIQSKNDAQNIFSKCVINKYKVQDYGEVHVDAVLIDSADPIVRKDTYTFVGTSLRECKKALIEMVVGDRWQKVTVDIMPTSEVDEDIIADGEVTICHVCGKMSEVYRLDNKPLHDYGRYFVSAKGEHIGVRSIDDDDNDYYNDFEKEEMYECPECCFSQDVAAIKAAETAEDLVAVAEDLPSGSIHVMARCADCGKLIPVTVRALSVHYEVKVEEGKMCVYDTTSQGLCAECATVKYGGGLDGIKDDITVNHGLWAFYKEESNVHGVLQRFKQFCGMASTAEFCATESTQFCGDFGLTIKHPEIKAAFAYSQGDAHSRRSEENGDSRYATRSFHLGLQSKEEYDLAVKENATYGNDAAQYVELIVRMGEASYITQLWVKESFAVGHPHFCKALQEVAEEASIPFVILQFRKRFCKNYVTNVESIRSKGFNALVSNYKVESESWGHFDLREPRPWIRAYLFNLLVKRAEKIGQKDRKAVIVCGLPGSGKSTLIKEKYSDYITIDADLIKWLLPEYNGGDASHVHKESCKLASWLTQYLAVKGYNVVIPMIGDNGSINMVSHILKECGYKIDAHFVDTDPEECARRCTLRKRTMSVNVEKLKLQRQQIIENMKDLGLK